jgi:hypothetical protein
VVLYKLPSDVLIKECFEDLGLSVAEAAKGHLWMISLAGPPLRHSSALPHYSFRLKAILIKSLKV